MDQGGNSDDTNKTQTQDGGDKGPKKPTSGTPIAIKGARDFDPFGKDQSEKPEGIKNAYDNSPATYWQTDFYLSPRFGNLKSGVGIILDLGKVQQVGKVSVSFMGETSVELRAASADAGAEPTSFAAYSKVANGSGTSVTLQPGKSLKTQYLLVWLTQLPPDNEGHWRGRVADIKVTS